MDIANMELTLTPRKTKNQRMRLVLYLLSLYLLIIFSACSQFDEQPVSLSDPVEPSDIAANESDSLLRLFTVIGKAFPGEKICTSMECSGDNQCCNTCSASLFLIDEEAEDITAGIEMRPYVNIEEEFVCSGNECEMTCSPMELNQSYRVLGTWQQDDQENYYLQVCKFAPLEQ